MAAPKLDPTAPKVVTFRSEGNGYGSVNCSWEEKPRKQPIAEWAVQRFAEGWGAELVVKGAW